MEMNRLYCYKENATLILQCHWSVQLLGNKPKKFDFVHQTISHQKAHVGVGTRLFAIG